MDRENCQGEIIVYQAADGLTRVDVRFEGDTVWLTQAQLVDLYHSSKANISEHIKHILEEGELEKDRVVRKFRTTAADGKNYQVMHYNLDMIIAIGYRVRTPVGTQFRQWATARLKEYMVKGFTLDDERLKGNAGGSYWKELLARIRDIRSSEKMLYRQVLDFLLASGTFVPPKRCCIGRCLIYMPPAWTMIQRALIRCFSSRLFRISCTTRLMDIRQQRLFISEQTLKNPSWDYELFQETFLY